MKKPNYSNQHFSFEFFSCLLIVLLLTNSPVLAGVSDPPPGYEEIVGLAEDKWDKGDLVAADSMYRQAFSQMLAANDVTERKLAHQLSHYAQLLNEFGQPDQTQLAVSESLYLYTETKREKPAEYVFAIVVLAESYELLKNLDEAEQIYSIAIEQERDLSVKNLNNVALGYAGLARINARRGDKNKASKFYRKSQHYYKL